LPLRLAAAGTATYAVAFGPFGRYRLAVAGTATYAVAFGPFGRYRLAVAGTATYAVAFGPFGRYRLAVAGTATIIAVTFSRRRHGDVNIRMPSTMIVAVPATAKR